MKNHLKSEIKTKVFCCEYAEDDQVRDPDICISLAMEKIPAHKIVLTTYSEIFAKTLSQNPTIKEIPLSPDYRISGPTMRNILSFLYTSELGITDAIAIERLKDAGAKLKIPYLLQKCLRLENEEAVPQTSADLKPEKGSSKEVPSQTTPTVGRETDIKRYLSYVGNLGKFDLEIVAKDTHFPVHSQILRLFSGYVDRHLPPQLEGDSSGNPYVYALLPGLRIGVDTLGDILLYAYSGQISLIPGSRAEELIRAAKILEVRELVKLLNLYSETYHKHTFPPSPITGGNGADGGEGQRRVAPVMHLSQLKIADLEAGKNRTKTAFAERIEPGRLVQRPTNGDYGFLMDRDADVACQFLGQDYFVPDRDEGKLFDVALAWIKHDFPRRLFHIEKVMRCIKFRSMTVEQLNYCARQCPDIIELSPYLRGLLLDAYKNLR